LEEKLSNKFKNGHEIKQKSLIFLKRQKLVHYLLVSEFSYLVTHLLGLLLRDEYHMFAPVINIQEVSTIICLVYLLSGKFMDLSACCKIDQAFDRCLQWSHVIFLDITIWIGLISRKLTRNETIKFIKLNHGLLPRSLDITTHFFEYTVLACLCLYTVSIRLEWTKKKWVNK
jgi:hypothetical protein